MLGQFGYFGGFPFDIQSSPVKVAKKLYMTRFGYRLPGFVPDQHASSFQAAQCGKLPAAKLDPAKAAGTCGILSVRGFR